VETTVSLTVNVQARSVRAFFFPSQIATVMTRPLGRQEPHHALLPHPQQDDFNQELQVRIAEALYDVDSIVADPEAYTKEELAALRSQILSNLEQAWELLGGSEDQLDAMMMQILQVVAREFKLEQ